MRQESRALVAALAFLFVSAGAHAQDRKDLEALRSRIEKLRTALAGAEENRSEAREELRESELAMSRSVRELRTLSQQRESLRKELQAIEARKQEAGTRVASQQQQLARMLAATYRAGEAGYVKLLLSGSDPGEVARDLHYLSYISRAHAAAIDATRLEIGRIRELEAHSREKTAQLETLETAHQAQHAELRRQRSARFQVFERISSRIRAQKEKVKTLERDQLRLARLVEDLARVIAAVPPRGPRNNALPRAGKDRPFGALRGQLRLPARGVVANRFGTPRVEGGPNWKGVFIRADPGGEVRAVAAGRVVFSEWMRGLGNLLVLDHGQGYLTIYGNNESVYRSVGEEVGTGDVVASVGASGGTRETGLYFEIRHEGRAFDPMSWITLR